MTKVLTGELIMGRTGRARKGGGRMNKILPELKMPRNKTKKKAVIVYEKDARNLPFNDGRFFDLLSEYSHDVVFWLHCLPELGYDYVSPSATRVTGYTPEEYFADPLLPQKCILPEDLHLFGDPIPAGTPPLSKPLVLRWRRKDGRIVWTEQFITINRNKRGEAETCLIIVRDITEQKEAEAKIQAQTQLIESILAAMPEGVLVVDSDDRVILANESVHRILHSTRRSLVNKPVTKIVPTDQLLDLYRSIKLGQKETGTLEFRYQVQDSEKIITCVATKMEAGRMLLTFTDVSSEREEEEKLYLTDRLASLGEMAAGLAHELNNPLTGILSLSQLLIDSDIPPDCREDLECINGEAKRAAGIVKNVLLFTRNNNYENGQASANEVVNDVLRLREYEEKTNNIKVVTNLQEDLPETTVGKYQLQQVFLNIILNAEAAIKDAGRPGQLAITTERVSHHINIAFTDNGCGIKKHVLHRIFDPFFTTKDIGKGTGLGLSICYGIVVKHGGKITVRTHVNEGTTFTVRLPVAPAT
jgi:signal transduction histidine kinase